MPTHPIQRLLAAEDLVRRRAPDEARRYAAAQRRGRIDANPHQVDAVVFALERIEEGGCILADEVGLGKTIEAGLVIAQMLAEGAQRILILVPKPLLGQWRDELFTLFGLPVTEVDNNPETLTGHGVFIAGREWAGYDTGSSLLTVTEPFDLVIIDEAHEIFANIHRRYDKDGIYQQDASQSLIAHRVREAVGQYPMMLLTATPIQNSLLELWGLVQYVEPTGTLLGDLPTFKRLFCQDGGRSVTPQTADDLKNRVEQVVQRTLRRQAQPFLDQPFVDRRTRLVEYPMSPAEQSLYDDVTDYLLAESTQAFSGNNRTLLVIGFQRRMASSLAALQSSLQTVARRLKRLIRENNSEHGEENAESDEDTGSGDESDMERSLLGDIDDEDWEGLSLGSDSDGSGASSSSTSSSSASSRGPDDTDSLSSGELTSGAPDQPTGSPPTSTLEQTLRTELVLVQNFIRRAEDLPHDGKALALLDALRLVFERGETGAGPGKVVIFTESLVTQDYIRDLLLDPHANSDLGLDPEDITLFRGTNNGDRAKQALARWDEEIGSRFPEHRKPSPNIAVRLALVHEFRTRSKVFISTEAGAKGLNLQFCDTIINYDLPWNPQRIEQRIGRCHRYGQTHDVMVINFIAKDNEAQQLTFRLLSQKLELFGEVLDATDTVLHTPGGSHPESLASTVGADLEKQMRDIYTRARTRDEIEAELRTLRDALEQKRQEFESSVERTHDLIETRLDTGVREIFEKYQNTVPRALRSLDRDMIQVVTSWLDALGIDYKKKRNDAFLQLTLDSGSAENPDQSRKGMPSELQGSGQLAIGDLRDADDELNGLHLDHDVVNAAVAHARQAAKTSTSVAVDLDKYAPEELLELVGQSGVLVVVRIAHAGLIPVENVHAFIVWKNGEVLSPDDTRMLLVDPLVEVPAGDSDTREPVDPEDIDDAVAEVLFDDLSDVDTRATTRFDTLMSQIERYVEDRITVATRRKNRLEKDLADARHKVEIATGPTSRAKATTKANRTRRTLESVIAEIETLKAREDDKYIRWRESLLERRYRRPTVERLAQVPIEIREAS